MAKLPQVDLVLALILVLALVPVVLVEVRIRFWWRHELFKVPRIWMARLGLENPFTEMMFQEIFEGCWATPLHAKKTR